MLPSNIKIYINPYKLKIKNSKGHRKGWLLLFDFGKDQVGYSDFLPWPVFGEPEGEKQLSDLKAGKESFRLKRSRKMAFEDSKGRKEKRNLFSGLSPLPPSHFLIHDLYSFKNEEEIFAFDYKVIKVKLDSCHIKKQAKKIKELYASFPFLKWRLDFKGRLSFLDWKKWKKELYFLRHQIDLIEDPFPDSFSESFSPFIAEDWISNPYSFIRIAKPSRDSLSCLIKGVACSRWKRVVFTHSLDHPLGQVGSAFYATQFYKLFPRLREIGGFRCFLYEENDFPLPSSSSYFIPPSGFGLGFGDILSKQKWKRWI